MIYFTTSVVRSHFNCFFFSFFVLVALNNPHFTHCSVGKMWVRLAHCSPSLGCCSLTTAVKSNVFPNWLVSVLWLSLSEKNHKEGNAKKKISLWLLVFFSRLLSVVCMSSNTHSHLTETCNLEMDNILLQSKSCAFLLKPTCFQRYNFHAVL